MQIVSERTQIMSLTLGLTQYNKLVTKAKFEGFTTSLYVQMLFQAAYAARCGLTADKDLDRELDRVFESDRANKLSKNKAQIINIMSSKEIKTLQAQLSEAHEDIKALQLHLDESAKSIKLLQDTVAVFEERNGVLLQSLQAHVDSSDVSGKKVVSIREFRTKTRHKVDFKPDIANLRVIEGGDA
jgi:septal ring factor EnvC (AmiA/AmiB activator)